jgi:S-adenosylmethionine:tRNA ribosyltransferase-isomerase
MIWRVNLSNFDYVLPPESIAQQPLQDRAAARMLLLERGSERIEDSFFKELPARLKGNELVVVNNARVIPARLFARRVGVRAESIGSDSRIGKEYLASQIEVLLVRRIEPEVWEALVRPGRKVRTGE